MQRTGSLILVGLFLWVTGCTTWKQIEISELSEHDRVRVTTMDGERSEVRDPVIEADSIRGKQASAFPVDSVSELEAPWNHPVYLALAAAALVGLVWVTVDIINTCSDTSFC